jgi:hypothetical protein
MIEKNIKSLPGVILGLGCMIFLLVSCKKTKEDTPVIISDPVATSSAASWISQTFATLNGTILANSNTVIVSFEYGTSTEYGLTLKAKPDTVTGTKNVSVYVNLTRLLPGTAYHFRVKAEGSFETLYGEDMSFTTLEPKESNTVFNPDITYGSVSDNDGNVYKTVQIGTQHFITMVQLFPWSIRVMSGELYLLPAIAGIKMTLLVMAYFITGIQSTQANYARLDGMSRPIMNGIS